MYRVLKTVRLFGFQPGCTTIEGWLIVIKAGSALPDNEHNIGAGTQEDFLLYPWIIENDL